MNSPAIVLILAAVALSSVQATDYCKPGLCPGSTNIACGHNGAFATTCPAGARIVNLTPHINAILNSHNTRRNLIASGGLSGYLPAKRMATMQWDNELASLAELNVKQCAMKHDSCHNTDAFKYSGQNLASFGYSGAEDGYADAWLIENRIEAWWAEYKDCKMEYIDKYPSNYKGPAIGHFTVMTAAVNIRVGCAASRYFDGTFNSFLIGCNYATTNLIGLPMYASGNAASGCTTGTNPQYSSLCSTSEVFNVNYT